MLSDDMNEFEQALLSVDRAAATAILERLANGNRPMELLEQVIVPTLDRIGENWDEGSVGFVSGVHEWSHLRGTCRCHFPPG